MHLSIFECESIIQIQIKGFGYTNYHDMKSSYFSTIQQANFWPYFQAFSSIYKYLPELSLVRCINVF